MNQTRIAQLFIIIFSLSLISGCNSNSESIKSEKLVNPKVDVIKSYVTDIKDSDYLRKPDNRLDALKIACYAISNNEWIYAVDAWGAYVEFSEKQFGETLNGIRQVQNILMLLVEKGSDALIQEGELAGTKAVEGVYNACVNSLDPTP